MPSAQQKRTNTEDPPTDEYVSPVKRVKEAVANDHGKHVIRSVAEMKTFIATNKMDDPNVVGRVVVVARVVWTSFDEGCTGPAGRIHLIDTAAPESLKEMHRVLRDGYADKRMKVDKDLMTASVYGIDAKSTGVPPDRSIIRINRLWKPKIYFDYACQFTTVLENIKIEDA